MAKLTTENFIKKAKEVHGDKYTYKNVNYTNSKTKITITCPIHGEFEQLPIEHLKAKIPCPVCRGKIPPNRNNFIERANVIHNHKYDYSKVGNICKVKDKVIITCPEHGDFEQEVNSHLQGRGCPICAGKKFDLQNYIKKANKVWNNKYDYSKFIWKGINQKVCIICPEHGEFWQLPNNHLKGECGCLQCRGKDKDFEKICNLEILIKKAKEKFGDKFNFDKTEFINSKTKIIITCPEHGDFEVLPYQFLQNKFGCPKCSSFLKYTTEEFIELCKKTHSEYDYDYSKVVYTGSNNKITVICPKHGEFYPYAGTFLQGDNECIKCIHDSYRLGNKEFIKRAKEIHGNYYDYNKVKYVNLKTPVVIICPKHGEFEQIPYNHLKGCNCPKCARENTIPSKGEMYVKQILEKYSIPYVYQKELIIDKIARNSNLIVVDFVIKYNNKFYFIEYNGKQHYQYIPFFHTGGEIDFEKQQRRDQLLRNFCELHKDKISLLEIPYTVKEEEIKTKILNFINYNKN